MKTKTGRQLIHRRLSLVPRPFLFGRYLASCPTAVARLFFRSRAQEAGRQETFHQLQSLLVHLSNFLSEFPASPFFFVFFFLLDRTNRIDWLTIRPESESEKEALNQIMQMANSSRNSFCSKESKIGRSQRMSNDPSSWCVSVRHLGAGRNGG